MSAQEVENNEGKQQLTITNEMVTPKRAGRRKINIEFIEDKSRRHITFSKRKAGIMKKAYELSTLTGTQVLLLVASETGHVYTFATPKLQPLITKAEGKSLIQSCLNSPDSMPPSQTPQPQQSRNPYPPTSAATSSPTVEQHSPLVHPYPHPSSHPSHPSMQPQPQSYNQMGGLHHYPDHHHHHQIPTNHIIDEKPKIANYIDPNMNSSMHQPMSSDYGYSGMRGMQYNQNVMNPTSTGNPSYTHPSAYSSMNSQPGYSLPTYPQNYKYQPNYN